MRNFFLEYFAVFFGTRKAFFGGGLERDVLFGEMCFWTFGKTE